MLDKTKMLTLSTVPFQFDICKQPTGSPSRSCRDATAVSWPDLVLSVSLHVFTVNVKITIFGGRFG